MGSADVRVDTVDPQEAAERLGLAVSTLARWRSEDEGPAYIKVGGRVRYRLADLASWLDQRTQRADVASRPGEEEDIYGEVDWLAELESAHARAERAEEIVRELAKDDDARAVIEWRDKYHRLRGRLQDLHRSYNEEKRLREYYAKVLREVRKSLGVHRTKEIVPALRKLEGD